MWLIYLPIAGCLLFSGCAAPFVLMVNPNTAKSVECSGVGKGLMSAIAVSNQVDNCVKQYEGLGYVRADNLTAEQRATLNVAPPATQHRTVIEPPAVITVPTRTSNPIGGMNCTSNQLGSSTYTNCY
jgi:hypothetical protein